MTNALKLFGMAVVLVAHAVAVPVTWTLSGVTFGDGGIATGSFAYDASSNTYSNVNITTTTGSARSGAVYRFVCGQDVPGCNGLSPNDVSSLNLTTNAANQTDCLASLCFLLQR